MPADPPRSSRRSLRLPDHDYSAPGAYFVTLVTHDRRYLFGKITNGEMIPNDAGEIVWETWRSLPARYPSISLDAAVVMPNHFHGIIIIEAVIHELPLQRDHELPLHDLPPQESRRLARRRMLIPLVIGYLKMNSAKRIHRLHHSDLPIWQRNYYDHIARNDHAYDAIRQYILSNPASWGTDQENRGSGNS